MTLNKQNTEGKNMKTHDRVNYIFDTATNDKGMNAKEKVTFHNFNSNGSLVILRELGWTGYDLGLTSGAFATHYYSEEMDKLQGQKKPRYNKINSLVKMMNEDIKRWEEKINKTKEGK
jgi:hypothetical protein